MGCKDGESTPVEGVMGRGWVYLLKPQGPQVKGPQRTVCLFPSQGVPVSVPKAGRKASALSVPTWQEEGLPAQQTSGLNQLVAE